MWDSIPPPSLAQCTPWRWTPTRHSSRLHAPAAPARVGEAEATEAEATEAEASAVAVSAAEAAEHSKLPGGNLHGNHNGGRSVWLRCHLGITPQLNIAGPQ